MHLNVRVIIKSCYIRLDYNRQNALPSKVIFEQIYACRKTAVLKKYQTKWLVGWLDWLARYL